MEERYEMFTVLIARATRCLYKIKTEEMSEFDLKGSHVSCIYYLYKTHSLTAKELCDVCEEDKANISRTIKYLEENGYIYSEADSQKKYKVSLLLTEKGKAVGNSIANKIDEILRESSDGLTEENRKIFYLSLLTICNNLERICKRYED